MSRNTAGYWQVYIEPEILNIKELKVFGDSNLIIQQVTGKWKVKNNTLRAIYNQVKKVEPFFTSISYEHVYRKDNKRADQLANIALDTRG